MMCLVVIFGCNGTFALLLFAAEIVINSVLACIGFCNSVLNAFRRAGQISKRLLNKTQNAAAVPLCNCISMYLYMWYLNSANGRMQQYEKCNMNRISKVVVFSFHNACHFDLHKRSISCSSILRSPRNCVEVFSFNLLKLNILIGLLPPPSQPFQRMNHNQFIHLIFLKKIKYLEYFR